MENGIEIVIISNQFSIVVKSVENGLIEQGYIVNVIDDDIANIRESMSSAKVYIMYLQDSMLNDTNKIKNLYLICDTLKDNRYNLILIGSENNRDEFLEVVPYFKEYIWVNRPVVLPVLIEAIETEVGKYNQIRAKKKILIIDDDAIYAGIISEWLKNHYDVESVTSGMQGLTWLANNKADLILLDYEMPVADGAKILEMLRSNMETSSIPVIFLTGIGTKESVTRVKEFKPQGYVLKTTTKIELIKTLNDFFINSK